MWREINVDVAVKYQGFFSAETRIQLQMADSKKGGF